MNTLGRVASLTALLLSMIAGARLAAQTGDPVRARIDEITERYKALWRAGDYEQALDLLNRETETFVEYAPEDWSIDRIALMHQLGRVDEAINEMEWKVFRRPTPRRMLHLAEYYLTRGRKEEADNTLARAQRRFNGPSRAPRTVEDRLARLRILELTGENPRALFQAILEEPGDESEADRIKRYIAAGELAFRKFDYQLAAEYFDMALEQEPERLEALAGLAECYWRSFDPRLEQTLERVLAINPRHFRGLAVKAEIALDGGQPEQALESIETALAVNPRDARFIGLKTGALFLLDRTGEMADWHAKALEFNPTASEVYRIAGRVASRAYRFKEGASLQRRALEANPDDNRARTLLAFDLLRLGQDREARDLLKESFKIDRFNVQVYNSLELMDTLEGFAEIKRGPFSLRMPADEAPVWRDEALALLRQGYDTLGAKYKVSLETPVYVQIFNDHDDFMVRSVGLPGSVGHLGICFGRLVTMDSPTARSQWAMNWRSVLWHEFAHVVTLQKTGNRIPRWLSEGISVYEETVADPSWGQRLEPAYRAVAAELETAAMEDLEGFFTRPQSQTHLMFGYFLAGEFVRFYVDAYGFDALVAALEAIAAKKTWKQALSTAAGVKAEAIDTRFRAFQKQRFKPFDNLPPAEPSLVQKTLGGVGEALGLSGSSPFTEAMATAAEAMAGEDWIRAERALEDARSLYPEYAGADGPLPKLAELYRRQDKKPELIKTLRDAVALDPTAMPALIELAKLLRDKQDWRGLADTARRALAVDPFDAGMRRHLWTALDKQGKAKAALAALDRLIYLDPIRAADYRLHRVDTLVKIGRANQAKTELIRLLEDAPYSWEGQQRLLDLIERQGAQGGGLERP